MIFYFELPVERGNIRFRRVRVTVDQLGRPTATKAAVAEYRPPVRTRPGGQDRCASTAGNTTGYATGKGIALLEQVLRGESLPGAGYLALWNLCARRT